MSNLKNSLEKLFSVMRTNPFEITRINLGIEKIKPVAVKLTISAATGF
ncbi:hypothetical protein [Tepidanaerobacter acetatoxydans]|nr:hypothetical protein [Tepidanaerobacter acetatoxydans]